MPLQRLSEDGHQQARLVLRLPLRARKTCTLCHYACRHYMILART